MKILVIHNFHRKGSASGDDQVFKSETNMLEENGNEVIKYTVINDSFDKKSIFGKLKNVFGMFWSIPNYKNVKKIIEEERPDIVHVHTFFPLLSPSIFYAVKKTGVKLVATLHDTRFICPCATSIRNGNICNLCRDGRYLRMFKHKCYKNSRSQSLIVALIFGLCRLRKTFYKKIDRYICLNDNQIDLLKSIGYDENKIVKKYNFVKDTYDVDSVFENNNIPDKYLVYYGRIGEEKGISVLMNIWDEIDDIPLVVMGTGPLEEEFKTWVNGRKNIYFLGFVEHKKCMSIVKNAQFVVFPSICYEGCSMVEIEAESLGKPIVAMDLGFSAEAIIDGYNGYKVENKNIDNFRSMIYKLWNDENACKQMGENARKEYEEKYREIDNYKQLMEIYNSTISQE